MNQRQLYILMVLLMLIVLILNKPERVRTVVVERTMPATQYGEHIYATQKTPYRLGLAFSGGGAKALCHVGVLKAFEEHGIKPDVLAGVSAGAVVAALYADGYTPDSILKLSESLHITDVLRFDWNHGGFFSMDGFKAVLDSFLRADRFEDLNIPLRVVATDLDRGQSVVFSTGSLVEALVASCSVPILFKPYTIEGINYVDGGVLQNLPAFAIRPLCKTLVGVSTGPVRTGPYDLSIPTIALRSYSLIFRNNATYAKELCDWVIEPAAINDYSGSDVDKYQQLFDIGYREANSLLEKHVFLEKRLQK